MPTGFLGTTQDALDVRLRAELNDVCRFGEGLTGLFPSREWFSGVGVGEGLRSGVPDRHSLLVVDELVVGGPPDLVVGRGGDGPQLRAGDGPADSSVEMWRAAF